MRQMKVRSEVKRESSELSADEMMSDFHPIEEDNFEDSIQTNSEVEPLLLEENIHSDER